MNPLVLSLAACPREAPTWTKLTEDTGTTVDTHVTDTDTDTTDTQTEPTDAPALIDQWTQGPALPACTPKAGDADRVALSGVVLTPYGAEAGYLVVDRAAGTVVCAGSTCDPGTATIVCTDGVISPALIDAHDHGQYNVIGPWRDHRVFSDRYDWQSDFDYYDFATGYDALKGDYDCETMKWGELREVVNGSTSMAGTYGDACIDVLARDLDGDAADHGIAGYELKFSASKVYYYDETDAASRASNLSSGAVDVYLDHVAEGFGGSVRNEIDDMMDLGMSGPGNVYIHATDASVDQLAEMAATGTGIVWSPRSNLDLYANTTPADVAMSIGVPVVIGPDWTWSGSNRVPAELSCARDWLVARRADVSDVQLWEAVTTDASVLLRLQNQLGMLVPGAKADVAVFTYQPEPYRAVIEAGYEDVRLVMIDGLARYGLPELVEGLEENPAWCEPVQACTASRTLCVAEADSGTDADTYADLEATLSTALGAVKMPSGFEYAGELYPLWACDEVRASCDPRRPTANDADGDGVTDAADDCRFAWDPDQLDHDRDGLGDACDRCPLSTAATCDHDPDDVDDDGMPNDQDGCPWIADPGSPDGDGDGHPDACDACPTVANPGAEACPATIHALRDPNDPAHPAIGDQVTIHDVVVTAVSSSGVFVQDPAETEYGGLLAYGATGAVGDLVDVTGQYDEYYGLTELAFATATKTGTATVPAPIVADPCDVGSGGGDAERYESMLVQVASVSVTDANPDDPGDYNEFEVGGCLRVDDEVCPTCWLDQPAVGTTYSSITGPLTYTYGNSKLLPRTAADLVP
jgi:hypothetical protein